MSKSIETEEKKEHIYRTITGREGPHELALKRAALQISREDFDRELSAWREAWLSATLDDGAVKMN